MITKIVAFVLEKTSTAEDRILIDIALYVFGIIIIHFFKRDVNFKKVWCDVQSNIQVIAYEIGEDIDKNDFMMYIEDLNLDDYIYSMEYKKRKMTLEMESLIDKFESLMVEIAKLDMEGVYFEEIEKRVRYLECENIAKYIGTIIKRENLVIV